jgi:hypothetical protein
MKCKEVQLWLLTAQCNGPMAAGLRDHLYDCARCRRYRDRVVKLDAAVRRLPVPPGSAAGRAALWERIGPAAPPVLPPILSPPLHKTRRARPWRGVLPWAAAAALLVAVSAFMARRFFPPRGDAPVPRPPAVADGHQMWMQPDDKAIVVRVARHDARLAETTDATQQLQVLTQLADDLKDEALRGAREGKPANVPLLAGLYGQVVRQGVAQRLAALPAKQKPDLAKSAAGRLRAAEAEVEAVAGKSVPVVAEMLRPMQVAARTSADRLEAERLAAPENLPPVFLGSPAPLLAVLVYQGLRLADETDLLRRADLCAELASYLAPAVVVLCAAGDDEPADDLSECLGDLLEHGVADSLDRLAPEDARQRRADIDKVREHCVRTVGILEQNRSKVPEAARAGLDRALEAARPATDRVRDAGEGKARPDVPPAQPDVAKEGRGPRDVKGTVKAVNAANQTIIVSRRHRGQMADQTYAMAKEIAVVLRGKPAKLGDLKPGMDVHLRLTEDRKTVERITDGRAANGANRGKGNK